MKRQTFEKGLKDFKLKTGKKKSKSLGGRPAPKMTVTPPPGYYRIDKGKDVLDKK